MYQPDGAHDSSAFDEWIGDLAPVGETNISAACEKRASQN